MCGRVKVEIIIKRIILKLETLSIKVILNLLNMLNIKYPNVNKE
jgi:hypothetical protein